MRHSHKNTLIFLVDINSFSSRGSLLFGRFRHKIFQNPLKHTRRFTPLSSLFFKQKVEIFPLSSLCVFFLLISISDPIQNSLYILNKSRTDMSQILPLNARKAMGENRSKKRLVSSGQKLVAFPSLWPGYLKQRAYKAWHHILFPSLPDPLSLCVMASRHLIMSPL